MFIQEFPVSVTSSKVVHIQIIKIKHRFLSADIWSIFVPIQYGPSLYQDVEDTALVPHLSKANYSYPSLQDSMKCKYNKGCKDTGYSVQWW